MVHLVLKDQCKCRMLERSFDKQITWGSAQVLQYMPREALSASRARADRTQRTMRTEGRHQGLVTPIRPRNLEKRKESLHVISWQYYWYTQRTWILKTRTAPRVHPQYEMRTFGIKCPSLLWPYYPEYRLGCQVTLGKVYTFWAINMIGAQKPTK